MVGKIILVVVQYGVLLSTHLLRVVCFDIGLYRRGHTADIHVGFQQFRKPRGKGVY